jgi:hypothetical protein
MNSIEEMKREQDERARRAVEGIVVQKWEVREAPNAIRIFIAGSPDFAGAMITVPKRTGREHIAERLAHSVARMPELLAACERMVRLLDPDEPLPSLEDAVAINERIPEYKKLIADIRGGAHA